MKQIAGDLLDVEKGILGHQVNLNRVMGAGLARQIAIKWPHVEQVYIDFPGELGDCVLVQAKPGLIVASLYGQSNTGKNKRQTHYGALAFALAKLNRHARDLDLPVYLPWKMSSDLAGADWTIVSELIEYLVPSATIVKLPAYDKVNGVPDESKQKAEAL